MGRFFSIPYETVADISGAPDFFSSKIPMHGKVKEKILLSWPAL